MLEELLELDQNMLETEKCIIVWVHIFVEYVIVNDSVLYNFY